MTSTFILTSNNGMFSFSKLDPYIHIRQNPVMTSSLWRMPSAEKLYPQPQKVLHQAILKAQPPVKPKNVEFSYTKFDFHSESPIYDLPPYENPHKIPTINYKSLGKEFLRHRARSFEKCQNRGREIDKKRTRSTSSGRRGSGRSREASGRSSRCVDDKFEV